MGIQSILYEQGNKPHFVSYSGGSTYTTQTYTEPPEWKLANTMTTEFGPSINGYTQTQPLAEFVGKVFSGHAEGLWIYRLFLNGQLVATYQMRDQVFCIPIEFDRVEGFCMEVSFSPSAVLAPVQTTIPVPAPGFVAVLICSAFFCTKKKNSIMRNSYFISSILTVVTTTATQAALISFSRIVTNSSTTTKSYEFLESSAFASDYSTVNIRGSLSIALTDFNGNGATLTPEVGSPVPCFYTAWINSNVVNNMGIVPVTTTTFSTNTFNQSFGSPVLETAIAAPANTMQMRLRFLLSPGDQVAISGTFETVAVPAPASLVMIMGSVMLSRRRR